MEVWVRFSTFYLCDWLWPGPVGLLAGMAEPAPCNGRSPEGARGHRSLKRGLELELVIERAVGPRGPKAGV